MDKEYYELDNINFTVERIFGNKSLTELIAQFIIKEQVELEKDSKKDFTNQDECGMINHE